MMNTKYLLSVVEVPLSMKIIAIGEVAEAQVEVEKCT